MSNFQITKDQQGEIVLSIHNFWDNKTYSWRLTHKDLHCLVNGISQLLEEIKKEEKIIGT